MAKPRLSAKQKALRRAEQPTNRKILYPIHDGPQTEFMLSEAEELLYGGAAGGGKSYALRAWGVTYCMVYPGARVVLFRRTYPELEDTHLKSIQVEIPTSVANYSSGSYELTFPNGSIFMFRHCEKEDDVRKYDTAEFDAMLFDELTAFSQFQYTYLTSRCRSTKNWWPGPRFRSATNPGHVGHAWVKDRWKINKVDPYEVWTGPASEGGMTRQFIPAKIADNPSLNDDYVKTIRALPAEEYRAKALGDWNVFSGQFFTRWRDDVHIIEPMDIPVDWDHFLCVDYGYNAPYAAVWFARPPNTQTIYVYNEQYGKNVPLAEQVYRAWQYTQDIGVNLKAVILDPAMFAKVNVKGEHIESMASEWQKRFARVVRGNNDRIPGWRLMREMIDWKEKPNGDVLIPPRFFVSSACRNTARTLPLLIIDEDNPEDIDTDKSMVLKTGGEDHAADALRYGLRHAFEGSGRSGIKRTVRVARSGYLTFT